MGFWIRWSQIAQHLPGRTDNEVKNLWHSCLKKKLHKTQPQSPQKNPTISTTNSDSPSLQSSNSTHSVDSPKYPLPRIFFAEWLAGDSAGAGTGFCQSFGSDGQNGAVYGGQPTAVIDSHDVKFEDQISNGMVNYYASAGDDLCVELLHFGQEIASSERFGESIRKLRCRGEMQNSNLPR